MVSDTIAHDINNLLMIVAGCCERLTQQAALTPAQVAELERIALATNQAASLTSQLISTNRGNDVSPSATDLAEALNRGAHLLEHAMGDRVRIDMRLAARTTWVPMSDGQISQVLINLALNARDAMPDGGVFGVSTSVLKLDATAAATHRLPAGEYVGLEVRDNGSGMDRETRARAFERFFSTKAAGRGTGLGLPSVKRVVEWCGGTIDLRSVPGQGTRFSILLPLVDEPPARESPADDQPMLRARAGETVMVAEDEPVVREIVASILRALGYDTLEASSAVEALAAMSARRVDLLVSDIDLPDLNGVELAARLAARSPATKVLLMSGYGDEGSLPAGAAHGSAFMQKPFTSQALGQKIREMLDAAANTSPAGPR